jgi:mRNA-degrading endonuclease RelE of RelBE toxin-antitoxin system
MNDEDKKEFIEDFKKGDGAARLDLWDYAIGQQVLWETIIVEIQKIAHDQGVDKKLEKMMDDDMKES